MEKYYRFAGVEVTICIPDQWMYEEDRQLAPFRVAQVCDPHIFSFELVDSISEPVGTLEAVVDGARIYRNGNCYVRYIGSVQEDWKLGYARAEYGDKQHFVQVRRNEFSNRIPVKTVLNSLGLEHLTAMEGGFVFHCSFVARDNGAILFTAPSGTGKSTQADLWRDFRNAEIINGDRAAVCVKEGRVFAEGIPFSGSSSHCLPESGTSDNYPETPWYGSLCENLGRCWTQYLDPTGCGKGFRCRPAGGYGDSGIPSCLYPG